MKCLRFSLLTYLQYWSHENRQSCQQKDKHSSDPLLSTYNKTQRERMLKTTTTTNHFCLKLLLKLFSFFPSEQLGHYNIGSSAGILVFGGLVFSFQNKSLLVQLTADTTGGSGLCHTKTPKTDKNESINAIYTYINVCIYIYI